MHLTMCSTSNIVQSQYASNKLQQKWFWCNTVLMYVLYNILKVASILMRGNWLFWPWKNQNVKIWPWNLIFKNVSLIVTCNILNWSITCLRSYKCIYAITKMKINLATMGGITVITQYVSVCVCVCVNSPMLQHNFVQCGWIATKLEIVIPDMVFYLPLQAIRYICQGRINMKTYFERIIIETSGILQNMYHIYTHRVINCAYESVTPITICTWH